MEALIVVAGRENRLNHNFSPKSLIPIFGVSLIERIILRAKSAGITSFKIVVGYKADQIMKKIGRSLDRFNAVGTGIFLCSPAIFNALEESISQEKYSLLAANEMLSTRGKLKTFDIGDNLWINVNGKKSFQQAKKILIKQLKKPEDDTIPRKYYRKISIWISLKLSRFNIDPNHLTLISFSLAALSGLFFFQGGYLNIVIGALIAQLSWIFDLCDREIARLKFKESKFGEFFDRVLDYIHRGCFEPAFCRINNIIHNSQC